MKSKLPPWIFILLTILVIGLIDYRTGDYVITVCYLLPVYLAARYYGGRWALAVTFLCTVELSVLMSLNHLHHLSPADIYFWNILIQGTELAVAGFLISKITRKSGVSW